MGKNLVALAGYSLTEGIYDGTKSLVYRGQRESDCTPVVIKLLKNDYPGLSELVQFRHQYTITQNLDLPGIVKPLSLENYGKGYALVMEDRGNVALSQWSKVHWKLGKVSTETDLDDFFRIATQIVNILDGLHHNRIIHKDIKPANIIINPATGQVKIIDFSIASVLPRETQTIHNPNVLEGTLAYLSPEQTGRMNRGLDYRTDFYSLGVTFYELLTGKLPFCTTDPLELIHCHLAQQPTPIISPEIPPVLSNIVMKLMAKNAEDRYQSAMGLQYDLEKCQSQWQETRTILSFALGERDVTDRFVIPEKLYGREAEVATLLAAFERVSKGNSEMMLVAGFSGIGKTAVVNEVHKPIVGQRGYFIKGKFEQFQRNVPFWALVQAFRDLVRQLLCENDAQLEKWQREITSALGENGQVIVDFIPELKQVIGEQPPVEQLSGSAAQNRFNLLFTNLIQVFTTKEHPLVIFLDDLQWADSASLNLIQLLISEIESGYLLLIGAYRDNEVSPAHPLMLILNEFLKSGASIETINLAPLSKSDVNNLVADTLRCSTQLVTPLTELIYQKTQGNPFFTNQFLQSLHGDGLIYFANPQASVHGINLGGWECNLARIKALAITDNVVEFMGLQLQKLPLETQEVIKLAACIGNQFDLTTLAIANQQSQSETATALWTALQEGLIIPQNEVYKFYLAESDYHQLPVNYDHDLPIINYKFLHDRVQQAAYLLIPEPQKQVVHFQIGKLLLKQFSNLEQEVKIFDIVNHLNQGRGLITQQDEQYELIKLNFRAGRKAKIATAYGTALEYLNICLENLPKSIWEQNYDLAFDVHKECAEVEYLNGNFDQSESLINYTLSQTRSALDQAELYNLLIVQYTLKANYEQAIQVGRKALAILEIELPEVDLTQALESELDQANQNLGERVILTLLDAPTMTLPDKKLAIKLLASLEPTAYLSNQELWTVIIVKGVNLSLVYGHVPESCSSYSAYGQVLGVVLGDYQQGYEFGILSLRLSEKFNNLTQKCKACFFLANILNNWVQHLNLSTAINNDGYQAGLDSGELQYTGYILMYKLINAFYQGENLGHILSELARFLHFNERTNNSLAVDTIKGFKLTIIALTGANHHQGLIESEKLQEQPYLDFCQLHNNFFALCIYQVLKLQVLYLFGGIEKALKWARDAHKMFNFISGQLPLAEHNFYYSLSLLSAAAGTNTQLSTTDWQQIEINLEQMKTWADNCPENFLHKYLLMKAEIARVSNQSLAAMEYYDLAISLAKEHGYVQEEALANELAGQFYLDLDKEKIAQVYLIEAYYSYARWGATAKVQEFEQRYVSYLAPIWSRQPSDGLVTETATDNQETIFATTNNNLEKLDLNTVIKASQTLSEEIHVDKLVCTLMQMAVENAGANNGALLLVNDNNLMIAAQYQNNQACNLQTIPLEDNDELPISVINSVKNSQKVVIVNDTAADHLFVRDPYLNKQQPKSFLCAPILKQGQIIAILYLENHLTTEVFTDYRLEIITIICSQAAISLENALLYQSLEQANAQLADYSHTLEAKVEARTKELKAAQQQIIVQEKLASLGTLTAGIAHELRNPLNFVTNYAIDSGELVEELVEILKQQQDQLDAEDLDYLMEITTDLKDNSMAIKTHGYRAESIIKSMMQHAQTSSSKSQFSDLNELLEQATQLAYQNIRAKYPNFNVNIETDYDRSIGHIELFPSDINRALINLIDNACYALRDRQTAPGESFTPTLSLQTLNGKDSVEIQICDNGIGIAPEMEAKIFNPFYTTKPTGEGTGLGLSLTHDVIVGQHRGTIKLATKLGNYTKFTIVLPKQLAKQISQN